jgi:predicted nuclease of predicted toxin-antitoxin system
VRVWFDEELPARMAAARAKTALEARRYRENGPVRAEIEKALEMK